jgi:excisionase family DNA binding protein
VNPTSEMMTVDEVADLLKVSPQTVYKLVKSKKLPGFRLGGNFRFRRADIYKLTKKKNRNSLKKP